MPQKYLSLCTPSLGLVSIDWAGGLRGLVWPMNYGYVSFFNVDQHGGEIAEMRNSCVGKSLKFESEEREVTHIFWLDDDVYPSRLVVPKLLALNTPIASGCYFSKCDAPEPLIFPGPVEGTSPFVPDQVLDVWGHGMGLCLIRTEVYRRMADELDLGTDKYGNPAWYRTLGGEHSTMSADGILRGAMTEDLYFLDRARELGYQPRVDTSAPAFGWHYDARKRQGYPQKQWGQMRAFGPVTWDTPEGLVTWK